MKQKRIIFTIIALVCLLFVVRLPEAYVAEAVSAADTDSNVLTGTCGVNLTWELNKTTGVLTISGTGAMDNYKSYPGAPWSSDLWSITSIKNIVIAEGVTTIGNFAFDRCEYMTEISIPSTVTEIGSNAFSSCYKLAEITVPEGVVSIGSGAFRECRALSEIRIPSSTKYISVDAFKTCTSLSGIWVDERNQFYFSDSKGVLYNKDKTLLIQAPAMMTSIYNIPESVISIEDGAFKYCAGMTEVSIPAGVTSIGKETFYGCEGLVRVTMQEGITSIEDVAFSDCKNLSELHIPSSVTHIGNEAFQRCSSLTEIVIPEGMTMIGEGLFEGCSSLKHISIPESVTSIGSRAFWGCDNLTEVEIPSNVTSIGGSAFYECSSLSKVILPEGLTAIADGLFYGCNSLTGINIPEGVTGIGNDAFYECVGLTEVNIPASVTSIGSSAFYRCSGLGKIEIPDGVISIGNWAFGECTSLTEVKISKSVTSISKYSFERCTKLEGIWVEENNVYFSSDEQGVLFNKDKTILLRAHSGLRGAYVVPSSVTTIGANAFEGCSGLTEVIVPSSLTNLEYFGLHGCSGVSSIKFYGDAPTVSSCPVPDGIIIYYSAGNGTWSEDCLDAGSGGKYEAPDVEFVPFYAVLDGGFGNVMMNPEIDWDESDGKDLIIRSAGAISMFKDVLVDDEVVSQSEYKVGKDSTIITISKEYLASLKDGVHTVTIRFTDGAVSIAKIMVKTDMDDKEEASTEPDIETSTEESTEPSTEAPTEESSEPSTDAPTEESTEPVTVVPTEESTEPSTEIPTEEHTAPSTEAPTEESTEPSTEDPTEESTEENTESNTEANTESATESAEPTTEAEGESENKLQINVSVKDNIAEVEALGEDVLEHLKQTDKVEINLRDTDAKIEMLQLSVEVIGAIAEAAKEDQSKSLVIEFSEGTVEFNNKVLNALSEQANGEDICLVLNLGENVQLSSKQQEEIKQLDSYAVVEAYWQCADSNTRISDFKGGVATLSIPFAIPEGHEADGFTVVYLAEDGSMEKLDTRYEDGKLVWEVGHFSDFVVMYESVTAGVSNGGNMFWIVLLGAVAVICIGAGVFVWRRRTKS